MITGVRKWAITVSKLSIRIGAIAITTTVVIFTPALAESDAADLTNPFANSSEAAGKGEELFGRNCQQCHNSRGKGGKGPQLVRGAWGPGGANTDAYMYRVVAGGRAGTQMGSFATSLTTDEIWQIITFLRAEAKRVKAKESKATDDDNLW